MRSSSNPRGQRAHRTSVELMVGGAADSVTNGVEAVLVHRACSAAPLCIDELVDTTTSALSIGGQRKERRAARSAGASRRLRARREAA